MTSPCVVPYVSTMLSATNTKQTTSLYTRTVQMTSHHYNCNSSTWRPANCTTTSGV